MSEYGDIVTSIRAWDKQVLVQWYKAAEDAPVQVVLTIHDRISDRHSFLRMPAETARELAESLIQAADTQFEVPSGDREISQ